ncbi:hypothetical protein [Undibacterium sp. TS12]|uniref:hypothetical protein n=1 Tax=Undibacterium sp. TS12 TaxID=2908202 RepID=UPI001F4D1E6E|nr:hypothetical protein [Undibacterium sp. TS12]MCH8622525.1 hypothetical protein [Undibacterium sp. TS12]
MKNSARSTQLGFSTMIGLSLALAAPAIYAQSASASASASAAASCPTKDWASKVLPTFSQPKALVPVKAPQSFCEFHQTTYESFVWATTMINGVPRFLTLKTSDELLTPLPKAKKANGITLNLASRNHKPSAGQSEGAGAIVEADGNMLVGPNGYPIYASVHMNDSYFKTAQNNLIANGGYQKNTDNFKVGAAVFKATWLRLGNGVSAPAGSFVTTANVPVLVNNNGVVQPNGEQTTQVQVALLGLHVVELTKEHPEFLWGTFEQKLNAPMLPDGTFNPANSNPNNFTLYTANTLYGQSNIPSLSNSSAPQNSGTFNATTQTFSPIVNVVQNNATGGDTSGTVPIVNSAGQQYLTSQKSVFANYVMIGTVWFAPNAFVMPAATSMGAAQGVGSVNLANSTAETFAQAPQNMFGQPVNNCFSCHNTNSYTFNKPALSARLVATSHTLAQGAPTYAVPNQVLVPLPSPSSASASASASTPAPKK